MYFGEFLLQKGIVNEDQLIEALAYQVEGLPSLIRTLKEGRFLSSRELLQLIDLQTKSSNDLIGTILEQNLLSKEQLDEAYHQQARTKKKLGIILVEFGYLTQEDLTQNLAEFNSQTTSQQSSKVETDDFTKIEKQLGIKLQKPYQKAYKDQLQKMFDEKELQKLRKLISFLERSVQRGEGVANYINSFYREIHLIQGGFFLVESQAAIKVLDLFEKEIAGPLSFEEEELNHWMAKNLSVINSLVDILWEIRENLAKSESDMSMWKEKDDWHMKYSAVFENLKEMNENNGREK